MGEGVVPWVPGVVIDVSKWQDSLPSLTGVLGVIARAGIGTKPDPMFATHIANARKAGKWVGSYWYNWGTLSISDQVNAYIAREEAVGGVNLHALDWEGSVSSGERFTAAESAYFIKLYRARTGNPIGLYASESWFKDLGQDWDWIANYSDEPTRYYDMWQYGPFRGVDGNHARQTIVNLATGVQSGGEMQSFNSVSTDYNIDLVNGARVFPNDDLTGTPIIVSPGRTFEYLGINLSGNRLIRWKNAQGDTKVYPVKEGWAGFVAKTDAGLPYLQPVPVDTTQYDQNDINTARQEGAATQKATDQAALDAAAAQHTADQAALTTAAADEKERIAVAVGQQEADRIRSI